MAAQRRWRIMISEETSAEAAADALVESSTEAPGPLVISPLELYLTYTQIALSGFGGTLFWVHRILVERKRWLTEAEFVEYLTLGQVIPGANIFNMALMIGHRFAGVPGAAAAGLGFMSVPFLIMAGLGALYQHFGDLPLIQHALGGMLAVAAGLLIANGVKMAWSMPRKLRPWSFTLLAFVCIGAMRWPLIAVVAVLAPFAVASVWKESSR
jgi:chromate transporter